MNEKNENKNIRIESMQNEIDCMKEDIQCLEKQIQVLKYPTINSLKDFMVVDKHISHIPISNERGETKEFQLFCNVCCESVSINGNTFSKGKTVCAEISEQPLYNLYQRWKEHVISGTHLNSEINHHPLQLEIWTLLLRVAYGVISSGDADSRYSREIQRSILNVGKDE